jgi:HEAT repeat protein
MPASESLSRNILVAVCAICTLVCSAWAQSTPPAVQETNPGTTTQAPSQNSEPGQTTPEPAPETKEQTPTKRARSADAKQEAWKILDDAASGDKTEQRAAAIRAIGLLPKNVRAMTMAEKALKDAKTEVRTAAALALGEMRARQSIPVLKAALDDPEPSVALAAGQALSQFHDPDAYSIFYEVLTGERKTGKGLIASQESILKDPKKLAALGLAQGVGFIPFGGFGWEAFKMLSKDDVSPVRASSARMLASDSDPASIKALENATSDKSWLVRTAALEALAKRDDPRAMDTVELSMYDDKDVVEYTAAAAFLRLSAVKEGRVASRGNAPKRAKPRHNKK